MSQVAAVLQGVHRELGPDHGQLAIDSCVTATSVELRLHILLSVQIETPRTETNRESPGGRR
jgi:hypothetical protein